MRRKLFRPIEMHHQNHVSGVLLMVPEHLVSVVHAACSAGAAKGMKNLHLRIQPCRNDSRSLDDCFRGATENLRLLPPKHLIYYRRHFFILPFAGFRYSSAVNSCFRLSHDYQIMNHNPFPPRIAVVLFNHFYDGLANFRRWLTWSSVMGAIAAKTLRFEKSIGVLLLCI